MTDLRGKTIYIQTSTGLREIGSDFDSTEDVEEYIQDNYDSGDTISFGVFDKQGSVETTTPPDKDELLSLETIKDRDKLLVRVGQDDRVENVHKVSSPRFNRTATAHQRLVRYSYEEIDFVIHLNLSEVSLSDDSSSEEYEREIRELFTELVGDEGIYLGYKNGYAQRGQRDPYTHLFGRVPRNTDKDTTLRDVLDTDRVDHSYWTSENLSIVPLVDCREDASEKTSRSLGTEDVVAVLDHTDRSDGTFTDSFSNKSKEELQRLINTLQSEYSISVQWVGKIMSSEAYQSCIGIKYLDT
jgi:hypothetical protein